jgi:hypothetical protein
VTAQAAAAALPGARHGARSVVELLCFMIRDSEGKSTRIRKLGQELFSVKNGDDGENICQCELFLGKACL